MFIVLALSLLLFMRTGSNLVTQMRQIVTDLSVPVIFILTRPVVFVEFFFHEASDYISLIGTNEKLRGENIRLRGQQDEIDYLKTLIRDYESLLQVQPAQEYEFITARYLVYTGGPFVRTIIINAGLNSGIESGQAVIGSQGLIGRVVSVGEFSARVLLITDLNSRIPVRIEPEGQNAILAGNNTNFPQLEFIADETVLANGARIVASGHGGQIPPGIIIGHVLKKRNQSIVIVPRENFANLNFVRVLKYKAVSSPLLSSQLPNVLTPDMADKQVAE